MKDRSFFYIGLVFFLVSGLLFYLNLEFDIGTTTDMGPGYFPLLLAVVMLLFSVLSVAASFLVDSHTMDTGGIKNMILIVLSMIVFAVALHWAGFVISAILSLLLVSITNHDFTWPKALVYSTVMSAVTSVVFTLGIGLQMPLWPRIIESL